MHRNLSPEPLALSRDISRLGDRTRARCVIGLLSLFALHGLVGDPVERVFQARCLLLTVDRYAGWGKDAGGSRGIGAVAMFVFFKESMIAHGIRPSENRFVWCLSLREQPMHRQNRPALYPDVKR